MRFKWVEDKGYPPSIDLLDLDIDTVFSSGRVGWVGPHMTAKGKYGVQVLWARHEEIEKVAFDSVREAMRALRLAYRVYRMGGGMYKKRET
jgi:hypothetical protein